MISALTTLWWLLIGHALCDYPLQGDFLARGKNHKAPIPGVPWQQCLVAHALIHAGAVSLITGCPMLGLFEFVAHLAIDYGKSEGIYGFNLDQLYHTLCKLAWVAIWLIH
jgi:hypothetical protein